MWKDEWQLQRFWAKVDKTGECWEWLAAKDKKGYGRFGLARANTTLAHRFSYKLHYGEIPEGLCICHHCDNPGCVRPEHLYAGTDRRNKDDMVARRRRPWGEAHESHKFTEVQVREIRERVKNRKVANVRVRKGSPDSFAAIAADYGVNESSIRGIIHGNRWAHLDEDEDR